jgi:hypothetical protein
MNRTNPLNRPTIVAAVHTLFQHGRNSAEYKLAIKRVIAAGDHLRVQAASPDQVIEIRRAIGIRDHQSA